MSKSWFGFPSVKFFGYKVTYGKREMDADRKQAILDFQMPIPVSERYRTFWAPLYFSSHLFQITRE